MRARSSGCRHRRGTIRCRARCVGSRRGGAMASTGGWSRTCRGRTPGRGVLAVAAAGLPGARLPAADAPRAGSRRRGALPASHQPPCQPTRLRGQGVSGPGGRPPGPGTGLRDLPLDRPAHAHAPGDTAAARPAGLGVDDFALTRRHHYATVITDAETGERIDVLPDRTAQTQVAWLCEHPGAAHVCRDGSGYGDAIRQALPEAVQVTDRRHLCSQPLRQGPGRGPLPRRLLGHRREPRPIRRRPRADCPRAPAAGPPPARPRRRPARMRPPPRCRPEHRQTIRPHEGAHRRASRTPRYKPTLVDPYRDHLRTRRAEDPAVPVLHLIRKNQGTGIHREPQPARPPHHPGPRRRRQAGHHPAALHPHPPHAPRTCATRTPGSCENSPKPAPRDRTRPPHLRVRQATAPSGGATTPSSPTGSPQPAPPTCPTCTPSRTASNSTAPPPTPDNGRAEGVNTRTKRIMRQMHGRAGFPLLRHCILLQ